MNFTRYQQSYKLSRASHDGHLSSSYSIIHIYLNGVLTVTIYSGEI